MKKGRGILLTALEYAVDYAPIIATVLLATFASLAAIRNIAVEEVLQWILGVLVLLATTLLVDRFRVTRSLIGKTEGLDQSLRELQKTLSPRARSDIFLRRRRNFPRMEQLIDEARNDIWVAGITLATMVSLVGTFETKLKRGCNIRFLALAPGGDALQTMAKSYGTDPDLAATRIRANLITLASRLESTEKSSVEIRVLDSVISTGYFITDPNSPKGQMIVQLYLYQTEVDEAPLFKLSKADDAQWFSTYMRQFEKAWEDARVFEK
jgi:hypothetical protein